jgi:hypothetical protein
MKALNTLINSGLVSVTDYATEVANGPLLTVTVSKPYWADQSFIELSFFSYLEDEEGELEFVGLFEGSRVGSVGAFKAIMKETLNHVSKWKAEGHAKFICEPTCDKRRSLYKKFIQGAGYKIIDDDDLCLSFE